MVGLAISGITSPSGTTVGWFTPSNAYVDPLTGFGGWQMVGYVSEAAFTAGDAPVPSMTRFYDTGGQYNNVTSAVFAANFGSSLTLGELATACCNAAIQTLDVDTSGTPVSFFASATLTS